MRSPRSGRSRPYASRRLDTQVRARNVSAGCHTGTASDAGPVADSNPDGGHHSDRGFTHRSTAGRPSVTMHGSRRATGLAVAALLVAACGAPAPLASPSPSSLVPGSSVGGASAPVTGTPTSQGLAVGTPLLVGQQTGGKAALADTESGPVVSVYQAQVAAPGPLPLGSGQPVGWNCPPSPVGIVGTSAVTWAGASRCPSR